MIEDITDDIITDSITVIGKLIVNALRILLPNYNIIYNVDLIL